MGIALLIDGISRLVHGFADKSSHGWLRGFRIGVEALEITLGIRRGEIDLNEIPEETLNTFLNTFMEEFNLLDPRTFVLEPSTANVKGHQ